MCSTSVPGLKTVAVAVSGHSVTIGPLGHAVLSPRGEYPLKYSLRREQDIDVRNGDAWSSGTSPCKPIGERSATWPNVSKV
jgi:hypothetical protein